MSQPIQRRRSTSQAKFASQEKRTEYQTSIPQALALMNSPMVAKATHPQQSELDLLGTLPDSFASLIKKMQERKAWAYQEGIARLLAEDILGCGA